MNKRKGTLEECFQRTSSCPHAQNQASSVGYLPSFLSKNTWPDSLTKKNKTLFISSVDISQCNMIMWVPTLAALGVLSSHRNICKFVLFLYALRFNPLNAELNPICHLLALLGAHHILHVSRIRVNLYCGGFILFYSVCVCACVCVYEWVL